MSVFLLNIAISEAATYSMVPTDSWGAKLTQLQPGDTLMLHDGTYSPVTIDCNANARNGTASAPITLKAEHERQAWLNSDGSVAALEIRNCAYWVMEGLHGSSADNPNGYSDILDVIQSNHLTFRRLLLHRTNQAVNTDPGYYGEKKNLHAMWFGYSQDILVEESELYDFHRHGFSIYHSDRITLRRNYAFPRGSATSAGEGLALAIYPGSANVVENNILNAAYVLGIDTTVNNRLYGNILVGYVNGSAIGDDWYGSLHLPQDTSLEHNVYYSVGTGMKFETGQDSIVKNVSFIDNVNGVVTQLTRSDGLPRSVSIENSLALNNSNFGFLVDPLAQGIDWSVDYSNAYNNGTNYSPYDAHVTNSMSIDPKLGSCKVWIPDNSPMKRAGKNGADIGANVLYRYENGVLTNQPLWDPVTGQFPCGAIVSGVNDVPGQSCFDVHQRLNVNTNGCPFPAGYGGGLAVGAQLTAHASSGPLRLDGQLTEAAWAQAPVVSFTDPRTVPLSDNTVRVQALWDATALYVGYTVTDAHLETVEGVTLSQDDGAEVYVDPNHSRTPTMEPEDLHLITTITDRSTVPGVTVKTLPSATGYSQELAIPWTLLSVPPTPGRVLGLLLANNDRDAGRSVQFDWLNVIATGDYAQPNLWGALLLEGSPLALTGDLTGDGLRNLIDVRWMIEMLVGTRPKDLAKADLTGDGAVTLADVQALIRLMVGLP